MTNIDPNHQRFGWRMLEAEPARFKIAAWLVRKGRTVTIPPTRVAPTADEWRAYADHGDLVVDGERVEAKQRFFDFVDRESFPYRSGAIVCSKRSFDEADPAPVRYHHLNRAGTHVATIESASRPRWREALIKDAYYANVERVCYIADLSDVVFEALDL